MKQKDLYHRLSSEEPINMNDPDFAPAIADIAAARVLKQLSE